ncbi:helix-turn-helix domain-containing protein, partial [Tateyamaria sp.]|nr:helix-turn-helix domain-containing protein [Tateyamaria sp.]
AFYAAKVNSDEYLPNGMISTAMFAAMLERRLVTPERLRMRGVR